MKTVNSYHKIALPFLLCFICIHIAYGSRLKQYTVHDGLSALSVTTIFQDKQGLLWLGTDDGISTFDGRSMRRLYSGSHTSDPFAGTTIINMFETGEDKLWVLSDKGLFSLQTTTLTVDTFPGFNSETRITNSATGQIFAVSEDNSVSWYHAEDNTFHKTSIGNLAPDSVIGLFVDQDNNLWIFTDDGNHRNFSIAWDDGNLKLTPLNSFRHNEPLLWCFYDNGVVYFVDSTLTFFAYNLTSRTKHYIHDIRDEVLKYGDISSIIHHNDDFFIGFTNSGLLRIKSVPEQRNNYLIEEIPIENGVSSLLSDTYQDIVWIGTPGEGIYMYYNEPSSLNAVLSSTLPQPFQSPITAISLDNKHTLWLATDGDGVVALHDYDPATGTGGSSEQFTASNSLLGSNQTAALAQGSRNLIWIGTDNGLNYYSYAEQRIKNLQVVADGKPLKHVRAICELNDTTLWIGTAGEGIVKARLAGTADNPIITSARRLTEADGIPGQTQFTVAYREDNNTVWFGTQEGGVWKIDSRSERMENIRPGKEPNSPQNTVFCIHRNASGYWFGTADGLVNLDNNQVGLFNELNGLPCKLVNGMLEDSSGNLWLSTDRGVVRFNTESHTSGLYKQSGEKSVSRFVSGAYYKDPVSHILFFGGTNGFVTINENDFIQSDFTPDIHFTGLSIFGTEQNIHDYLTVKNGKETIRLTPDQNVFAVSFVAHDYIDGDDYNYFYRLDELGDNWVDNGNSNTAMFTYLSPGTYTLSTRYRNNATGKESAVFSLRIRITSPWYHSWWAYLLYALVFILIILIVRIGMRWQYRRIEQVISARLNRQFMADANKHKLGFFTAMANELYASLALIFNPARNILSAPGITDEVRNYTGVIEQNARYIESFIKDITELKLLETGERKLLVQTLPVSELADFIAQGYLDKAAAKQVDYQILIDSSIYWNTDSYCLRSIINTLLAYTFVHIRPGGTVSVQLTAHEHTLQIQISGSSVQGDQEQVIGQLTRHTVVEAIETQSKEGLSVHNQLTLGICHNMVRLLDGNVDAALTDEAGVTFKVDLPQLSAEEEDPSTVENERPLVTYTQTSVPQIPVLPKDPARQNILVLSADPAICWLIAGQLASRYNLEFLTESDRLRETLHDCRAGLILSEINLPDADGIELVRELKADAAYTLLPFGLLASANTADEKQRAVEAGAELYIGKPFDMSILEKEIDGILQYKELQNYYTNALTRTFELGDEHFAGTSEKQFYDSVLDSIDRNLNNPELSVELICNELGCTSQEFYSRLKGITRKTPNEIIREYRLNTVELLLVSTTLPVEEIIDKAGFTNKANFFKVFSQKYGMTPRNYRLQNKRRIREAMDGV